MPIRTCRVCGCTDLRACPGGCFWVTPDLCSSCIETTIAGHYESFRKEVVPAAASPTQVQEMRRAFYAGAAAHLSIMAVLASDEFPEDQANKVIDDIATELATFMNEVVKGEK